MRLLMSLPENRTIEQLENHYTVEKKIADQIKKATRSQRPDIYKNMYNTLFEAVPDHPRLTTRKSTELTERILEDKFRLVRNFLFSNCLFAEFAPGDCNFSAYVTKYVKEVTAFDISDQRANTFKNPQNFTLELYNGYDLDNLSGNNFDVIFSDQLIEHFHPEDTLYHFCLVNRLLKEQGKYVFRTPHLFNGPHDISKYFSHYPECFHLKEWTYTELIRVSKVAGYKHCHTYYKARNYIVKFPNLYFYIIEKFLKRFPIVLRNRLSRYLIPTLYCVFEK